MTPTATRGSRTARHNAAAADHAARPGSVANAQAKHLADLMSQAVAADRTLTHAEKAGAILSAVFGTGIISATVARRMRTGGRSLMSLAEPRTPRKASAPQGIDPGDEWFVRDVIECVRAEIANYYLRDAARMDMGRIASGEVSACAAVHGLVLRPRPLVIIHAIADAQRGYVARPPVENPDQSHGSNSETEQTAAVGVTQRTRTPLFAGAVPLTPEEVVVDGSLRTEVLASAVEREVERISHSTKATDQEKARSALRMAAAAARHHFGLPHLHRVIDTNLATLAFDRPKMLLDAVRRKANDGTFPAVLSALETVFADYSYDDYEAVLTSGYGERLLARLVQDATTISPVPRTGIQRRAATMLADRAGLSAAVAGQAVQGILRTDFATTTTRSRNRARGAAEMEALASRSGFTLPTLRRMVHIALSDAEVSVAAHDATCI